MAATWTTTQQAGLQNGVKILGYGDSGVGKTLLCATAPRPMIVSAENRLLTLRHTTIPVAIVRSVADAREILRWLYTSAEAAQFDTVCLDSATEIAEVLLQSLKASTKDGRRAYGEVQDIVLDLLRAFRDLPRKHVYVIAKQIYEKDEATGAFVYKPLFTGNKLGPQVPYLFDEVFAFRVGKDPGTQQLYRYLQTQADMQYVAKDSSGALQPMEAPDLSQVIGKILGGKRS